MSIYDCSLTDEQVELIDAAYMTMLGYAWTLKEIGECWYIEIRSIEQLDQYLIVKIRNSSYTGEYSIEELHIDFDETNVDELAKYKILYYTERNRELFFEAFLGKYVDKESEEYKCYAKWIIKEQ